MEKSEIEHVDLSHEDIIALDREGRLPPVLVQKWLEHFNKDPVEIAERILWLDKRSNKFFGVTIAIGSVGIGCALIAVLVPGYLTILPIGLALLLLAVIVGGADVALFDGDVARAKNESKFPYCLSKLCNESGMSLERIAGLSEQFLKEDAKWRLVQAAREIVLWERAHLPNELDPTISKDALVKIFKDRHEYLRLMGLAAHKYGPYFELAKKQLDEAA